MTRSATGQIFEAMTGRKVIENKAWACLERCRRKLRLEEIPLPVPVEDWIEGTLGIRLSYADLSRTGAELEGGASFADNEILIDETATANEARLRFTCAHELGHMILHRKAKSLFHHLAEEGPYADPQRFERQADRFAAAFLMPVPLVERELIAALDARCLKRGKAVTIMMQETRESEWLWRYVVLPHITRRFGVTISAAINRFADLQPLARPKCPLMPDRLAPILRERAGRSELENIRIEDGLPVYRSLFDKRNPYTPERVFLSTVYAC
jgi:hypothetical protein